MPAQSGRPDQAQAGGTVTTADDIRREFYEEAPFSQWIVELQLDPLTLIVSDDSTGQLLRVPVILGAAPGEVTFGPGVAVLVDYITAPVQTTEAAKGGPGRKVAAAWATRQTSRVVTGTPARRASAARPSEIIAAAVARGAITADRARRYLEDAANGQDVTWVARLWGPGHPSAAGGHRHQDPDEAVYARLYPTAAQTAAGLTPPGVAPPPPGYGDLTGDGPPDPATGPDPGDLIGHGAMTAAHDHSHSDYAGGQHSHPHAHQADSSHAPGDLHRHDAAPAAEGDVAASKGIAARRAARLRTDPADPAATASDEQLYVRLFGRLPGG